MDVTTDNFRDICDPIIESMRGCSFISFDCEFTGIRSEQHLQNSLFDAPHHRYEKIRKACDQTLITQYGLSIFKFDRDKNAYSSESYTFYLCPQWFADIDQDIRIQGSSLNFLRRNNFDFNKFVYKGIPYFSQKSLSHIQQLVKNGTLYNLLVMNLSIEESAFLNQCHKQLTEWISSNNTEAKVFHIEPPILKYLFQKEVRNKSVKIMCKGEKVIVEKITLNGQQNLSHITADLEEEILNNLVNEMNGFSFIFQALVASRKPIVGHNLLYDLLLVYYQFIGPLPNTYKAFKREINKLFPTIYDTKHITSKVHKYIKRSVTNTWDDNSLSSVYYFFTSDSGRHLALFSPSIKANVEDGQFHQAGWDSYCTGFIFIRLAHWQACEIRGTSMVLGVNDHLHAMKPYCNAVNLLRANIPYINLDKPDPPSHRPVDLLLETRHKKPIDFSEVSQELTRFGSMDIRRLNSSAILVAVASHNSARRIISHYDKDLNYRVKKYNRFQKQIQLSLWCTVIAAGGVVALFLWKLKK